MKICLSYGKQIDPALTYCNHYGTKLKETKAAGKIPDLPFVALIFGKASVFVIGFGYIIGLFGYYEKSQFWTVANGC